MKRYTCKQHKYRGLDPCPDCELYRVDNPDRKWADRHNRCMRNATIAGVVTFIVYVVLYNFFFK
ncbi:MAG: hypothetical protein JXN64_06460 [Spirochaetes bacterium]|nr:hypothetical protein [Spirochaetota bacterium]